MTQDSEQVVAAYWSEMATKPAEKCSWTDSPAVMRHVNRMISGDPDVGWLEYACRKYLMKNGRGVARGLSIGCGGGALERHARQAGACETIDAIDIAPGAIEEARKMATLAGVTGINYAVANLDGLELAANTYSVAFASSSIHHVINLEQLFANVAKCLEPGGLFIMLEYVGASQFQFSEKAVQIINDILALLPLACRQRFSNPGEYVAKFDRTTIEYMNEMDPSEAIRSADILPLLAKTFTIIEKKDFGGTLLHMLLQDIVHNFPDDLVERAAILNLLLYLETLLIRENVIPSDFCFVVSTPLLTAPGQA
jgi:2-polyprenyl-3-methyl-5-hydroxy-6-metoxy-1,4-benzoquinol methylase